MNGSTTENGFVSIKSRPNFYDENKVNKNKVDFEKEGCDPGGFTFRRPLVDKNNIADKDRDAGSRGNLVSKPCVFDPVPMKSKVNSEKEGCDPGGFRRLLVDKNYLSDKDGDAGYCVVDAVPTKSKLNSEKEGCDPGDKNNLADKDKDKDRDGDFRGNLVNKTDSVRTEEMSSHKWQCPRKRKPYMGPPLKQLGLE